jgi:hypothetical protein
VNPICNASSGIFGLWGVLLVDVLVHRQHHLSHRFVAIISALAAVVTAIIFGLLPFVDYFGPLAVRGSRSQSRTKSPERHCT